MLGEHNRDILVNCLGYPEARVRELEENGILRRGPHRWRTMTLKDQVVVVIGGSSGIGLATAKAAVAEGARVTITARSKERLDAAAVEIGHGASAVALDASDEAGTRAMFEKMPRVDHIFVNAGGVIGDGRLTAAISDIRPAMDIRFWGAVYAAKYARPKMRDGGSIVVMSGTAGMRPIRGAAVASASCAAVEGLARSLAADLSPVRVNAIRPGLIDTPLIDQFAGERKEQMFREYSVRLPVGRVGRAEEVADAVLFLMKNGFVSGITLTIDGGGLIS
jgi:NAD(P)-dependent dehydrogenase (short-subunit alcohol dehydrogenase family)